MKLEANNKISTKSGKSKGLDFLKGMGLGLLFFIVLIIELFIASPIFWLASIIVFILFSISEWIEGNRYMAAGMFLFLVVLLAFLLMWAAVVSSNLR